MGGYLGLNQQVSAGQNAKRFMQNILFIQLYDLGVDRRDMAEKEKIMEVGLK